MNLFGISVPEEYLIGKVEYVSFQKAAKIIDQPSLGRNKLLQLLRDQGWLDQYNFGTNHPIGSVFLCNSKDHYRTPIISIQGVEYIKNELLN